MSDITYRDIPDYPYYRAGDDGSIWSCRDPNTHAVTELWRPLSAWLENGYYRVCLFKNKLRRYHFVHHLILTAFVGERPEGLFACHNDGNRTNNKPSNLRWDTAKANAEDKIRHGTQSRGDKQGLSKLNDEKVREIRARRRRGDSMPAIARAFGVTKTTIQLIINGTTWKHVEDGSAA